MKRIVMVLVGLLILGGCGNSLGSFEDGTLDMKQLIQKINHESNDGEWEMPLVKETSEDMEYLKLYGFVPDDVVNYGIYTSVVPAIPAEIAIFEVSDEDMEPLKEQVQTYVDQLQADERILSQYRSIIADYKEAEIGNYYIVVIGKDAARVLQFIEGCA